MGLQTPIPKSDTVRMRIECLQCPKSDAQERDIPYWAVPVMAIAHHSSHEGHQMRVHIDGEQVWPIER